MMPLQHVPGVGMAYVGEGPINLDNGESTVYGNRVRVSADAATAQWWPPAPPALSASHARFNAVLEETLKTIHHLQSVKGGEYEGTYQGKPDRLGNFKRGAELTGTTPLQVLFIYLSKHYDAVATYVRDEAGCVNRVRSEPVEGRLDDLIVYCILAKALIREQQDVQHHSV